MYKPVNILSRYIMMYRSAFLKYRIHVIHFFLSRDIQPYFPRRCQIILCSFFVNISFPDMNYCQRIFNFYFITFSSILYKWVLLYNKYTLCFFYNIYRYQKSNNFSISLKYSEDAHLLCMSFLLSKTQSKALHTHKPTFLSH